MLEWRLLLPYTVLQTFPQGLDVGHVKIKYLDEPFQLPERINAYKNRVMKRREAEAEKAGRVLFDGKLVRLVDYFPNENDGILKLTIQPTSFFAHSLSNKALEDCMDELDGRSPIEFYKLNPKEMDSILANPIGVNSALVTSDNHVIIVDRSTKLSQYPGLFGIPAGFMKPEDKTPHGTGYREVREEVGNFDVDMKLVELGRALDDFHIEINMTGRIYEKNQK